MKKKWILILVAVIIILVAVKKIIDQNMPYSFSHGGKAYWIGNTKVYCREDVRNMILKSDYPDINQQKCDTIAKMQDGLIK